MNAHDDGCPGIDEGYWQAILSQGEVATTRPSPDDCPPWEGFSQLLSSPTRHSPPPSEEHQGWTHAIELRDSGATVELRVTGYNRGGLLVEWNGLHGFVPASQLSDPVSFYDDEQRCAELAQRVGRRLRLKVIEVEPEEGRLILSERIAAQDAEQRARLLDEIQPGDVRRGQVTNLCPFGVFVDLGGVEGLIHISELSWGRVDHPRDVLRVGQEIDVYVLNVNPEQERIGLSFKRLLPDPWENVQERYEVGQLVKGVVTNVVNFGAFVRIEEGLEGLIHVSELAEGTFLHPRNVVQEGEQVVARVLNIDSKRRRMALSLRQAPKPQADAWAVQPESPALLSSSPH